MKNNLVKAVASIATATTLLFTTSICFAAEANTVTTYSEDAIKVTSTVTGIEEGTMVTYLAGADNGEIASKDDIQYITQWTSAGINEVKTISYDLKTVPETNPLATVKYGSDDSEVATALNTDTNAVVKVAGINAEYDASVVTLTVADKVGVGSKATATIAVEDGYEVVSITVNGTEIDKTATTFEVPYDGDNTSVVIVTKKVLQAPSVETAIVITDKVAIKDGAEEIPSVGAIGVINGEPIEFGIYVEYDNAPFAFADVTDGYFAAMPALEGTNASYYAVNIAGKDLNGKSYKVYTYAKYADGTVVKSDASDVTAK